MSKEGITIPVSKENMPPTVMEDFTWYPPSEIERVRVVRFVEGVEE